MTTMYTGDAPDGTKHVVITKHVVQPRAYMLITKPKHGGCWWAHTVSPFPVKYPKPDDIIAKWVRCHKVAA